MYCLRCERIDGRREVYNFQGPSQLSNALEPIRGGAAVLKPYARAILAKSSAVAVVALETSFRDRFQAPTGSCI